MVTFFTLEIGLANFSDWIFDSFLGLLLPSIPSLKCMQSMKSKLAETNICQPNACFRAKRTLFHGGTFFQPGNRSCKIFSLNFRQLFGFAFVKHPFPEMDAKYEVKTRRNTHMSTKYILPRKTTTVKSAGHINV